MDPARDGVYEAVPLQCFACAARDAEQRHARKAMSNDECGDSAFDGLFFAVREREVNPDG